MFGLFERPFSPYFNLEDRNGVTVVAVTAEEMRHPDQAREFGADLRKVMNEGGKSDILVDLEPVRFLGSTALAVLLGVYRDLTAKGGRLRISSIDPDVLPGANISGLTRLVTCYASIDDALAAG